MFSSVTGLTNVGCDIAAATISYIRGLEHVSEVKFSVGRRFLFEFADQIEFILGYDCSSFLFLNRDKEGDRRDLAHRSSLPKNRVSGVRVWRVLL